ncbi:hypothetical protein LSAT2_021813 [Lamellibrachia satsuma]|nr:hypothetical protein LSAT2_021813 [Lamellibrachia satsuma]
MPSLHRLTELKELLKGLGRSMGSRLGDSDGDDDDDDDEEFVRGNRVRVDADVSRSSRLQEGHGGWNKDMKKYLGKVGVVKGKLAGNIVVQFPDGRALLYNKALLKLCDEEDTEEEDRRSQPFKRYDIVVIEKNKDRVMGLQEDHGGWKASLVSVLGKNAIVNRIDDDGDVFLELPDDTNQLFNPKLLTVIDTTNVKIGVDDLVVVIDCYKTFRALQEKANLGWTSDMRKILGSAGKIVAELSNGLVEVFMASRSWVINVKAVTFISRADGTGAVEQMAHAKGRARAKESAPTGAGNCSETWSIAKRHWKKKAGNINIKVSSLMSGVGCSAGAYSPTNFSDEKDVVEFYESLNRTVLHIPPLACLVIGEYVTMDDDLSLAEALGADWEDTHVPRFQEGQCDATESASGREADEEQVP